MKTIIKMVAIANLLLLVVACTDYKEHTLKGVLYTDSTLSTPIVGDTLVFRSGGKYLGFATTNHEGKWAFSFYRDVDNPNMVGTKWQYDEECYLVMYHADTLYAPCDGSSNLMKLYPGCFKRFGYNPTPVPDTTSRGGEQ